ncbi:Hsp20/alpha crystallin family protein [Streptomyces sp. B4I13]|uniref:Hsp20/alpha crystallin family protein n=1 Tax=Streptomyces sp. B4I13 TaxID=3042271 RepID=UPI0027D8074E|nr:Hsp20/alpha crystallin family protein [Streptomyces sp. B4I13]
MIERWPDWPVLPDLFGWIEGGIPGLRQTPGVHGIHVEQRIGDGTYILRAELPRIDPAEDVEITVAEGVLTLRTERSEEKTERHHTEFRYGAFARAVRLPAGACSEDATAEYKDGVLTITAPVPETKTGTRTIPVRHA